MIKNTRMERGNGSYNAEISQLDDTTTNALTAIGDWQGYGAREAHSTVNEQDADPVEGLFRAIGYI